MMGTNLVVFPCLYVIVAKPSKHRHDVTSKKVSDLTTETQRTQRKTEKMRFTFLLCVLCVSVVKSLTFFDVTS